MPDDLIRIKLGGSAFREHDLTQTDEAQNSLEISIEVQPDGTTETSITGRVLRPVWLDRLNSEVADWIMRAVHLEEKMTNERVRLTDLLQENESAKVIVEQDPVLIRYAIYEKFPARLGNKVEIVERVTEEESSDRRYILEFRYNNREEIECTSWSEIDDQKFAAHIFEWQNNVQAIQQTLKEGEREAERIKEWLDLQPAYLDALEAKVQHLMKNHHPDLAEIFAGARREKDGPLVALVSHEIEGEVTFTEADLSALLQLIRQMVPEARYILPEPIAEKKLEPGFHEVEEHQ